MTGGSLLRSKILCDLLSIRARIYFTYGVSQKSLKIPIVFSFDFMCVCVYTHIVCIITMIFIYLFRPFLRLLLACLLGQVSRQLALFVFCFMISCAGREFHLVSSLSASFKTQFVSPARFKDTRKSVRQLSNMRGRVDDECSVVRASLSTWREEYSLHADSPYVVLRERIKIVKHVTVPAVAL